MAKDKISVYSTRRPDLAGSWPKKDVEKELAELGTKGVDWVDYVLDRVFADEEGLDTGAIRKVLGWSSSGLFSGSVTFTCPKDGATVSVIMT